MRGRIFLIVLAAIAAASLGFAASQGVAQYGSPYPGYPPPMTSTSTASTTNTSPSPAPPTSRAAKNSVQVGDFFFKPSRLKVKKGQTVTWTWVGQIGHNVTFASLHKHSRTQASGTYKLRFAKKGTYHYECTIHHFTGVITVR